jgi:hypothetical protein
LTKELEIQLDFDVQAAQTPDLPFGFREDESETILEADDRLKDDDSFINSLEADESFINSFEVDGSFTGSLEDDDSLDDNDSLDGSLEDGNTDNDRVRPVFFNNSEIRDSCAEFTADTFFELKRRVRSTADDDDTDDSGSDTSGVFSIDLSDNEFKSKDVC